VSVLAALVFCGIFLKAVGSDPVAVYAKMLKTVCSAKGLTRSIQAGIPLMLTGLAVSCDTALFNQTLGSASA
jgi:simple sugar transport system permease protein